MKRSLVERAKEALVRVAVFAAAVKRARGLDRVERVVRAARVLPPSWRDPALFVVGFLDREAACSNDSRGHGGKGGGA